ncbi:hypothetical protein [Streptomyces sp. TN58]|uniref:hypothetical protein n=1 Tax=Streptomyces sp. TN58 TaxID=234612 RepID=UPI0009507996|nr:hypothetical protein [Streptomyces sp. TN58]APU40084.1 hypothetical protein BSL84_10205 [Streptomyces sp. TN58]
MTVCAIEMTTTAPFTISADGSYAARLAGDGEARFAERWTLAGPEPYAVPLPLAQPEEADSELLPLADGRVLIHRRVADRHAFALLYPTGAAAGPRTGELQLGGVDAEEGVRVFLLPPAPDGCGAFAVAASDSVTTLWQVAGGAFGPQRVARIPGRCSGGVWLDRTGRLLALDRELEGTAKAVTVDLGGDAGITPLLQITEDSDDRLLLADPDSGLLLIRSDAPGEARLGWGVLGSSRPVRFPECLRLGDAAPFAVQPGQALMPETCGVALRLPEGDIGLWRPADRYVFRLAAPAGWLGGAGLWSPQGRLHLPYALPDVPCGIAGMTLPAAPPPPVRVDPPAMAPPARPSGHPPAHPSARTDASARRDPGPPPSPRPVPLQQAPLAGR